MEDELTSDVQKLVHASKSIVARACSEPGLVEKDCEAVLFSALELLNAIELQCEKNHQHVALEKGIGYLVPDSRLLRM